MACDFGRNTGATACGTYLIAKETRHTEENVGNNEIITIFFFIKNPH